MPAAILLQIRPVNDNDRRAAAHQPARHAPIDVLTFDVQMTIAKQPIKRLERRTNALGTGPRAGQIHQRQTTTLDQCLDCVQQRSGSLRVHPVQCIAQALLQYFGRAHGVVSSGFVTHEE